jgi:hypothetical protein
MDLASFRLGDVYMRQALDYNTPARIRPETRIERGIMLNSG